MNMKKLYFLNEEESTRILNFHKESTKRQYLSETIIDGKYKSQSYDYIYVDFEKNTIELNGPLQCENRSGEIGDNELGLLKGTVFSMICLVGFGRIIQVRLDIGVVLKILG